MKKLTFIDLFCGIGGIRQGMTDAGFQCVFSCDSDKDCQKTYFENFIDMPYGDIKEIGIKDIPDFDVLCAGFPCQPFSISGRMKGFEDTRGTLFFEICRIIKEKQPKAVMLENVKHLVHHDNGKTLEVIIQSLQDLGYNVNWRILNAKDFGVPQNRERIIIVATQDTTPFNFDALPVSPCTSMRPFLDREGDFEYLDPKDYTLLEKTHITQSGLIFAGYRNKALRKVGVKEGTEHLSRVHKQPNRIYSVAGLHPTLPAQEASGRFFILDDDGNVRKLTMNECYRFMGFPQSFIRVGSMATQYKQIGNSVCVPMISAVAELLYEYLGGDDLPSETNIGNTRSCVWTTARGAENEEKFKRHKKSRSRKGASN